MNEHKWTRVTRDFIRLEDITVDGQPVDIADLSVALVPARSPLTDDTVWVDPTADDDGTPQVLVAGPDAADLTSATVITTDADLFAKVSKNGTVVVARLARVKLA